MTDSNTTKARITETDESDFAVDIEVSGHHLKGDEPESSGGKNTGPAPYDLLLAALGECTAMTVRWYAKKYDWPLDRVEVEMTYSKEASTENKSGKTDVFTKKIVVHGDKLTAEQREKLIDVAAKCPVQRTMEGTPVIKTINAD